MKWLNRTLGILGRSGTNDVNDMMPTLVNKNICNPPVGKYKVEVEPAYYLNDRRMPGTVSVLCGNRLIFKKRGGTPYDARVAGSGTTMVCYELQGIKLATLIRFVDIRGNCTGELRFGAISYSSGISEDGSIAVVQFANSNTEDGGALAVIDVNRVEVVERIHLEGGWAESYNIHPGAKILEARYSSGRYYRYSFAGDFLDKDKFRHDQIECGEPTALIQLVRRELDQTDTIPEAQQKELLAILDRADARGLRQYRDWHAIALRARGEIHESRGSIVEAIAAYREALERDPKIGVRRKLAALERSQTRSQIHGKS
jgi:hypothetical protein